MSSSKTEIFSETKFTHEITYTNEGKIPVSEIAESLLANEQLIKLTVPLLEKLYPGLEIKDIEIHFKNASHNSPLQEIFGISLFVSFQEDLENEVPELIEYITGKEVPESFDSLITVAAFVLLYYGADYLFSRFKGSKSEPISKGLEQTIHVAGDYINMPPDKIEEVVKEVYTGQRLQSLAKASKGAVLPAKRERNAQIVTTEEIAFTKEAVNDFPSDIDFDYEDDFEKTEPYQRVRISLRATDLDKNNTGWAGVIKKISDARLKMEVYPTIDLQKLHGKKSIVGDILLVSKKQPNGSYKPASFHLLEIHEPKRRKPKTKRTKKS
ncbi:MAG: hypothetical protein CMH27_04565 [Micavibrio sp.]|nr:hypothetical protein [Micavibrio sp.]|tara:strand:+ start:4794 stop:5768 length:975 start_codon:yes stop_codon:yes gene_type:complete